MRETLPFPRRKTGRPLTSTDTAGGVTFNAAEFDKVIDPKGQMTLTEKAALLGVPLPTLSLVVNGRRQPNTDFIAAVRRVVPERYRIERFFNFGASLDEAA